MRHLITFLVNAAMVGAVALSLTVFAHAEEVKVCDLGEALRQPERLAEYVDCSLFTVKVLNRPVACGLYNNLSRRIE